MAYSSFKKPYNGQTYSLDLHPDNSDSFSDDGAVRNFTWTLEGRAPLNEYRYYGGLVTVFQDTDFHDDMEDVELTLTPRGERKSTSMNSSHYFATRMTASP